MTLGDLRKFCIANGVDFATIIHDTASGRCDKKFMGDCDLDDDVEAYNLTVEVIVGNRNSDGN